MNRLMLLLLCLFVACSDAVLEGSSASNTDLEAALPQDDQCGSDDEACAFNALQVMRLKSSDAELAVAAAEDASRSESEWLKDISVQVKNYFKHKLSKLQKPIVALYKNFSILDKKVAGVMNETADATGEEVVWNRKSLLQSDDSQLTSSTRRRSHKSLPPRARYVNKILIYLDKEMQAVWNLHTIADRKRWGIANVVTSHPYGPTGGPSLAQQSEEEQVAEPVTNTYQEQLEEDYESLLKNIKDAGEKLVELRGSLANTTEKMHAWLKESLLETSSLEASGEGDAVFEDLTNAGELQEDSAGESQWLKDISVKVKNEFKHKLSKLQKPIVALYKNFSILDKKVAGVMNETADATGEEVVWNRKSLLQTDDSQLTSSTRRRSHKSLPPRARYVNKILIYLDKEMQAVWNLHTIADRKRWGIANVVTSHPYGPTGGPSLAQQSEEEQVAEPVTNTYQEQLEEDYESLLKNIKDAGEKLVELRGSLANTTEKMHAWQKVS